MLEIEQIDREYLDVGMYSERVMVRTVMRARALRSLLGHLGRPHPSTGPQIKHLTPCSRRGPVGVSAIVFIHLPEIHRGRVYFVLRGEENGIVEDAQLVHLELMRSVRVDAD